MTPWEAIGWLIFVVGIVVFLAGVWLVTALLLSMDKETVERADRREKK